jgi:hypothetical protein
MSSSDDWIQANRSASTTNQDVFRPRLATREQLIARVEGWRRPETFTDSGPPESRDIAAEPWTNHRVSGLIRQPQQSSRGAVPVIVDELYDGTVIEVDDDEFVAELIPRGREEQLITADFLKSAVLDDDLELVEVGSAFYVTVGRYQHSRARHSSMTSIRFRRLGIWRSEDVEYFREKGVKRALMLGFDQTRIASVEFQDLDSSS